MTVAYRLLPGVLLDWFLYCISSVPTKLEESPHGGERQERLYGYSWDGPLETLWRT